MTKLLVPMNTKLDHAQHFSLNTEGEERVYFVGDVAVASIQAEGDGSWGTAIITIQRSNDQKHWYDLEDGAVTIGPGSGMTGAIPCDGFMYLRARLTTVEGAADTCQLTAVGQS